MSVVPMVAGTVVAGSVIKVSVWDATVINIAVVVEVLAIGVLTDVDIILEFAVTVPYFGYVPSGMVIGALTGEVTDVMMGFVSDIGVEVLADANVIIFASLMTALEFAVPKPLGGFSC